MPSLVKKRREKLPGARRSGEIQCYGTFVRFDAEGEPEKAATQALRIDRTGDERQHVFRGCKAEAVAVRSRLAMVRSPDELAKQSRAARLACRWIQCANNGRVAHGFPIVNRFPVTIQEA